MSNILTRPIPFLSVYIILSHKRLYRQLAESICSFCSFQSHPRVLKSTALQKATQPPARSHRIKLSLVACCSFNNFFNIKHVPLHIFPLILVSSSCRQLKSLQQLTHNTVTAMPSFHPALVSVTYYSSAPTAKPNKREFC